MRKVDCRRCSLAKPVPGSKDFGSRQELLRDGIPFQVIPDGAAGALMAKGEVTAVIVGADRIAANGDTANKIGTYSLAVLAHHHGIPSTWRPPFYP